MDEYSDADAEQLVAETEAYLAGNYRGYQAWINADPIDLDLGLGTYSREGLGGYISGLP